MQIKLRFISAIISLFALTSFLSMSYADLSPNTPGTFLQQVEVSRAVIIGKVNKVQEKMAVGGLFDEAYKIAFISGTLVDSSGTRKVQNVKVRMPPHDDLRQYHSGEHVLLITGIDLVGYSERVDFIYRPILSIKNNLVYLGERPLEGIDEHGYLLLGTAYNTCDISDFPAPSVWKEDEDGNVIEVLSPQEALDSVMSFGCPDGTQWNRRNEGKESLGTNPIASRDFFELISAHLKSLGLPPVSQRELRRDPSREPAKLENRDAYPGNDELLLSLYEELSEQDLETASEARLARINRVYERVEARKRKLNGRGVDKANKEDGIVDWTEYPNFYNLVENIKRKNKALQKESAK